MSDNRKLLSAFTRLAGTYPPYTNFSLDGDMVEITVRGEAVQNPKHGYIDSGPTATHRMHKTEFAKLLGEAASELFLAQASNADETTKATLRRLWTVKLDV